MNVCVRFIVSGFVQGVGFRYYVYRRAVEMNLSGYAKNLFDGSVEVVAEGDSDSLEKLFEYLKIGPSRSVVDRVIKEEKECEGQFKGFSIL